MRKFFLKVTGKSLAVEEKEEVKVEEVEGGSGARRRWRLAKNMLVAFKVASTVLSVRMMMMMTATQVEREEEEEKERRRRAACGRRLSFLGQQYPNMVMNVILEIFGTGGHFRPKKILKKKGTK